MSAKDKNKRHIEKERKYRRKLIGNFKKDARRLKDVFAFVNGSDHYVYVAPEENIDPELLSLRDRPMNFKQARRRFYWANKKLRGYNEDDRKDRLEIRTDRKNGVYDMDAKRGGPASEDNPTMVRDEESRTLKENVISFRKFPKYMTRALVDAFRRPSKLKIPVYIDSYTAVMQYHPEGRDDVTLEIKFDYGKGFNFLGHSEPVIEFEIEILKIPDDMCVEEVAELWKQEEEFIKSKFDDVERVLDSKPSSLFYNLVEQRATNRKQYSRAWDAMKPDWMHHKAA